jgi:hypothetical protein
MVFIHTIHNQEQSRLCNLLKINIKKIECMLNPLILFLWGKENAPTQPRR